jgi:hypothetical protein
MSINHNPTSRKPQLCIVWTVDQPSYAKVNKRHRWMEGHLTVEMGHPGRLGDESPH